MVADSSKIALRADAEPFMPSADGASNQALIEEEKIKTVERLYRYYSSLICEQNKEKLYSQPEQYKSLAQAVEVAQ